MNSNEYMKVRSLKDEEIAKQKRASVERFILLYTADENLTQFFQTSFRESSMKLECAATADHFKWEVANLDFDVILLDDRIVRAEMIKFVREGCKGNKAQTPILIMADPANKEQLLQDTEDYADILMIERPWTMEFMLKTLVAILAKSDQQALERKQSAQANETPEADPEQGERSGNKILLKPGNILITKGDSSDRTMYYVEEGELIIYDRDSSGQKDVIFGKVKKGEVVGELSFLDSQPRSASVKAETYTRVTVIDETVYNKVIKNQPSFIKALILTLCQKLRHANLRLKV